jgi:hypothetical protein
MNPMNMPEILIGSGRIRDDTYSYIIRQTRYFR